MFNPETSQAGQPQRSLDRSQMIVSVGVRVNAGQFLEPAAHCFVIKDLYVLTPGVCAAIVRHDSDPGGKVRSLMASMKGMSWNPGHWVFPVAISACTGLTKHLVFELRCHHYLTLINI